MVGEGVGKGVAAGRGGVVVALVAPVFDLFLHACQPRESTCFLLVWVLLLVLLCGPVQVFKNDRVGSLLLFFFGASFVVVCL
jgi:hypothetical protein